MNKITSIIMILFNILITAFTLAQIPTLPEGSKTQWIIKEPEEIVSYLIFDSETIKEKIPPFLRTITIKELASSNISWAKEHLEDNPNHNDWGIGFIEIIRAKIFEINGQSPQLSEDGAIALWFVRSILLDSLKDVSPDQTTFLALEFWLPDSIYANYMRNNGYYANYGDVRLRKIADTLWIGTIDIEDLNVSIHCIPKINVESIGSSGIQLIFPPVQSEIKEFVRIAFAGHKIHICKESSSWIFKGSHPLVKGIILGESSFQYGYELIGKTYNINY